LIIEDALDKVCDSIKELRHEEINIREVQNFFNKKNYI